MIDTAFRPQAPSSKHEGNLPIDRRWCQVLALAAGDRVTARQLCESLRGDLARLPEVYLELPPDRVATRTAELRRGVAKYLGGTP